jgi:hypothetical protein
MKRGRQKRNIPTTAVKESKASPIAETLATRGQKNFPSSVAKNSRISSKLDTPNRRGRPKKNEGLRSAEILPPASLAVVPTLILQSQQIPLITPSRSKGRPKKIAEVQEKLMVPVDKVKETLAPLVTPARSRARLRKATVENMVPTPKEMSVIGPPGTAKSRRLRSRNSTIESGPATPATTKSVKSRKSLHLTTPANSSTIVMDGVINSGVVQKISSQPVEELRKIPTPPPINPPGPQAETPKVAQVPPVKTTTLKRDRLRRDGNSKVSTPVPVKGQISSTASPMATPIPARLASTTQQHRYPLAKSEEIKAVEPVSEPPKFEAWTSKFIKNPPPSATPKTPRQQETIRAGGIAVPTSSVEFVPPPTVTRRRKDPPIEYCESPLTKAKRIDAQSTWREKQLQTFLAAKAEAVKSALGSLREQASRPTPSQVVSSGESESAKSPQIETVFTTLDSELGRRISINQLVNESMESHPKSIAVGRSASGTKAVNDHTDDGPIAHNSPPPLAPEIVNRKGTSTPRTMNHNSPPPPRPPSASMSRAVELSPRVPLAPSPLIMNEEMPQMVNDASIFDFEPLPESFSTSGRASNESVKRISEDSRRGSGSKTVSASAVDPIEIEKRRRLKERNDKALEKRKQMFQKAQQIRSNIADLSGKPKDLPKKPSALPVRRPAPTQQPSLQKQAMVNNAVRAKGSDPKPEMSASAMGTTGRGSIFRMPLPKVKTPGGPASHPSSDETFAIPPQKPTTSASPVSPRLPEIHSEYHDR